jgi:hypothetical protein
MAKVAVLGRVKTRLGREIGPAHALRLYRATAAAVLGRLAADARFETLVAVSPDADVATRTFPHLRRIAQGRGDIGQRMLRAAARAPRGPVLVIGLDIPSITAAHLCDAFRSLGRNEVTFGPAADGGFWLVGFRKRPFPTHVFERVRWSSLNTLADACANLADRPVGRVATLSDIDTKDDLARVAGHVGRRVLPDACAKPD